MVWCSNPEHQKKYFKEVGTFYYTDKSCVQNYVLAQTSLICSFFVVYPNSLIIILRSNYLHIWVYKMRGDYELFLYFFFQKILVSFIVYKPHWSNDINICIFLFYHLQFCVVCLFLSIAIMPYIAKRKKKKKG